MRRSLLLFVFAALPAGAADLTAAQRHVNSAAESFRGGDFEAALASLRAAEPIAAELNDASLAPIRFNIARCLEELKRNEEALAAYRMYLRQPDQGHRKQRALRSIGLLEKTLYGSLAVTCQPVGAKVIVRGGAEATGPCPLRRDRLAPGTYRIKASFDGYLPEEKTVEVVVGKTAAVSINLQSDGPGIVMPSMGPPPDPVNPWPWVAVGTGVAAAGAGVFFTFNATNARDEAESLPPGGDRDGEVDAFETSELISWVGYGVGAAAITTGVLLWVFDDDEEPAAFVPHGNGVLVRW